jgi:hypothetical protein
LWGGVLGLVGTGFLLRPDGVCFSVSADFLSLVDLVGTRVRNKLSFGWVRDGRTVESDGQTKFDVPDHGNGTDKESWTLLLRTTYKGIDGQRTTGRSGFFDIPNMFFH